MRVSIIALLATTALAAPVNLPPTLPTPAGELTEVAQHLVNAFESGVKETADAFKTVVKRTFPVVTPAEASENFDHLVDAASAAFAESVGAVSSADMLSMLWRHR